jgi:AraC-like DNA-binding protein
LNQVDTTLDFYKKVTPLDSFFERNIQPFQEHQLIEAVNLIFKEDYTILEISEVLRINRKTLLRIFNKHLNCSPKEFSNLVKFKK